jgi:hypothetical protein
LQLKAIRDVGIFLLCLVLLAFAGIWAKVWVDSHACFLRGERWERIARADEKKSDYLQAVTWYLESVRCQTPGSRDSREAARRAISIAEHFEATNDTAAALRIYYGLKSALLSLSYFYQPLPDILERVDKSIRRFGKR